MTVRKAIRLLQRRLEFVEMLADDRSGLFPQGDWDLAEAAAIRKVLGVIERISDPDGRSYGA